MLKCSVPLSCHGHDLAWICARCFQIWYYRPFNERQNWCCSLNNYRGITLILVISKLFEFLQLEYFENVLLTDDLQFGFKKGLDCSDAIFTLSETIEYFRDRGSTVYAAALDINKAFDCVNHYKFITSFIKAGLP